MIHVTFQDKNGGLEKRILPSEFFFILYVLNAIPLIYCMCKCTRVTVEIHYVVLHTHSTHIGDRHMPHHLLANRSTVYTGCHVSLGYLLTETYSKCVYANTLYCTLVKNYPIIPCHPEVFNKLRIMTV